MNLPLVLGLCLVLNVCFNKADEPPQVPKFTLNGDIKIPSLGYGTWQANDDELEKAVELALEAGYRHIDTAAAYENEKVIGRVLNRWISSGKVNRSDLFIVTKLPPPGMRPEHVELFLNKSLSDLQLDYVDLYLVHTPFAFKYVEGNLHPHTADGSIDLDLNTDHVAIWKKMEEQQDKGRTRSIGISNFNKTQIQRILNNSRIKPSNLQIECHAYNQQNELVDFCKKNNIVVTAYSPLGSPGLGKFLSQFGHEANVPDVLGNPVVSKIAKKHNRSEAQVLLRHLHQRGIVAIPKSTNPKRLKQNIDIFDFTLDDQDMSELNALDKKARILDFTAFKGIKNHPEYPFAGEK
ncbi:1,5-anhydro-D-fructose reductase isoform X2 [Aethina tumida]|uniref:1,5-anhydro-D-fructose reductase isoform X2 n=1 Tax=Aethina tumida TaxID=116153 RepID=UPI002148D068|nr:1,5-anhydro-D-fructose reductase isoform X2 [Aethina tumida]